MQEKKFRFVKDYLKLSHAETLMIGFCTLDDRANCNCCKKTTIKIETENYTVFSEEKVCEEFYSTISCKHFKKYEIKRI